MIFVPVATKLGKRFSLLVSLAMLFAILCWTAEVKTFKGLLAARCVSGFASAAGEASASRFLVCNSTDLSKEYRTRYSGRSVLLARKSGHDVGVSLE